MGRIGGVNLSGYLRENWYKQAVKNLRILVATFGVAISVAGGLIYFNKSVEPQIHQQQESYQQSAQQLVYIEKQISQIRQNQSQQQPIYYLSKAILSQFIQQLTEIVPKGVLEMCQLSNEGETILKIAGNLPNIDQFEQITSSLKQKEYFYKIDQFQTNEKNQLAFSLLIYLDGNQNEKLDYQ